MAKLFRLEEFEPNLRSVGWNEPIEQHGSGSPDSAAAKKAYENGYQAGWEDAALAAANEQSKFSAEFSHNLQDIGFTFHEARSHVVGSMETLLHALVDTLLPEVMAQSVGARILEEIVPLAEVAADRPIQITVSPENRTLVEPLLGGDTRCPLELAEEPSLGSGQVLLRSGPLERQIDLGEALSNVRDAFDALLEDNRKVFANG